MSTSSSLRMKIIFSMILTVIIIGGCKKNAESPDKVNIVASILPLAEFAEQIGGDRVQVSVMVPAGITPHNYEPTPSQLTDINNAHIYIKVGTPIEFEIFWLDKILTLNQNMLVCDASKNLELDGSDIDPHIWLSPLNAMIMIENIYNAIVAVDAKNKGYYTGNKTKYVEKLLDLDKYIRELLGKKKNRQFIVYHPAWGHFARAYDLEQVSIEKEGKEPTAKSIMRVVELARERNIHTVFASPQFTTKSAQVIAREIQGQVILIDPLEKKYITNLNDIAEHLAHSME